MNRRDFEKGSNELEALVGDESKVASLLGALPRVEAPANFDFGVKSRIAAGAKPERAPLFPWLKLAVPVGLVFLIAAFVVFYGVLPRGASTDVAATTGGVPVDPAPQTTVAESQPPPPAQVVEPRSSDPSIATREELTTPAVAQSIPKRTTKKFVSNVETDRGGFVDSAWTDPGFRLPRGFDPGPANRNVNGGAPASEIDVNELLQLLGVSAELVDSDWTVRSTVDTGFAARAGVKANDVIEAIGDQDISAKRTVKGMIAVKYCRVRRDGKQLRLEFKK